MHLATIGCNGQEILLVHLTAIGCNGINSFYHPFYLDVMQGKYQALSRFFVLQAWAWPGCITHTRLVNIQYTGMPASLIHPHAMTKAIFFVYC